METSVLLYSLTLVRIELRREEGIVFGHFLAKLALVLLLELAETCSTLKMEMSRSWFDENSKREAWFLRAKLALFLSTSSLHLTAPEVDPALHCISFKTDLHWIGAHNGAKTFLKFSLMIFVIFLGNVEYGFNYSWINLPFFQSVRFTSLHQRSIQHCTAFPLKLICIGLGHTMGPKHFRSFYVFINDFVVFPEKCIEFGIDLICLFSTKLLHL